MKDPRAEKLAEVLFTDSVRLAAGDRARIETFDVPGALTALLVRRAAAARAIPLVAANQGAVACGGERNIPEGEVVRRERHFVVPDLAGLNPGRLQP